MLNMLLLIKFIGVLIIVQACIFILRIDLLRELLKFVTRGNRIYLIAAIRIIVAVLLFVGATQCRRQWIIISIGIILLLSGIAIFSIKPAAFNKLIAWYQRRTDLFLRLLAVIGIVFGSLILYAV